MSFDYDLTFSNMRECAEYATVLNDLDTYHETDEYKNAKLDKLRSKICNSILFHFDEVIEVDYDGSANYEIDISELPDIERTNLTNALTAKNYTVVIDNDILKISC